MSENPLSSMAAFFSSEYAQDVTQLSDEEFWRYAQRQAHLPSPSPSVSAYLKCSLDEGSCVFPLAALQEVIPLPPRFTLLPSAPTWMLGLTSWRDETLAAVDLRAYFSHTPARQDPDAALLIARNGYITLGLSTVVLSSLPPPQADSIQPLKPTSGQHRSSISGIIGLYEDAFVVDIASLLTALAQEITMAKPHE